MLKVENLHVYYGAIHALKGVSLSVEEGKIVSLLGSNGAGKSTLVNTLAGLLKSRKGKVNFRGQDVTNQDAFKLVKQGLSLSPEGREVFPALTVEENLRLGAYIINKQAEIKNGYERCYDLFPKLRERRNQYAGTLSGGEQQMLAIGRALMSSPALLLLDEPSLGLAPNIVSQIFGLITKIAQQGTTILLIEQNANMALQISDFAYVMEQGAISMFGPSAEIIADDRVKQIYLGL